MTAAISKQNTVSNPSDWDGLLREFAKQQDAHISARKSANQSKRDRVFHEHDINGVKRSQKEEGAKRSRSIDVVDDDDDSDADDFEGFEEYSHRLGYLDSVTSSSLEEKVNEVWEKQVLQIMSFFKTQVDRFM